MREIEDFDDPSKPLDNPEHERFCQLRSSGKIKTDWEAYQIAYDSSRSVAESCATRLRSDAGICGRIQWIQSQATKGTVLSLQEKRELLASIGRVQGTEVTTQHILGAIELDAKLCGELNGLAGRDPHVRLRVVASGAAGGSQVAAEVEVGGD